MKTARLLTKVLFALMIGAANAGPKEHQVVAPQSHRTITGSWEGFLQDDPVDQFITVTLTPEDETPGSLHVLGRAIPFKEVIWDGDDLTVVIGSRGSVVIKATRSGDVLAGELRQGDRIQQLSARAIPEYPVPQSRAEAWSQDIDVLTTRFIDLDHSFSPAERAMFLEKLAATRQNISQLSDDEIVLEMASAVALANEPHTRLVILRNATRLRRLPVRFWWFSDGLYVVRSTPEYRHLLGCRVDDFAGTVSRHARDVVGRAFSGNPSWQDYMSVYSLSSPELLNGAGVTPDIDEVELGISGCPGPPRRRIEPLPLQVTDRTIEAWWDLSPLREIPQGLTAQVLDEETAPLPLYLLNSNADYWFQYIADAGVLYFQYNRAQHDEDERMDAFGARLLAEIDQRQPRALIIDLRFNTGGNAGVSKDLMRSLHEHAPTVPRYVITGRSTFSAGISALAQLLSGGTAVIVGEPPGDDLEHWSEGGYVQLPNSGIEVDFQTALHSYSVAPCPADVPCFEMSVESIEPDLPVSQSWSEYRSLMDPAMDLILQELKSAPKRGMEGRSD